MDILARIVILILSGISIPFIAIYMYKPLENFKELNIVEKVLWGLLYIFILNWFVILPSIIFMECFKYIFL